MAQTFYNQRLIQSSLERWDKDDSLINDSESNKETQLKSLNRSFRGLIKLDNKSKHQKEDDVEKSNNSMDIKYSTLRLNLSIKDKLKKS